MPIVNPTTEAPPQPKDDVVEIAKPLYRGTVVDTEYIPKSALITNIDGSPWTVDYYSQVLDDDSALNGQQPELDPIYQQYTLIRGMEIKVTTPLSMTQDQATSALTMTGTAHTYPFLIPNAGDMFIADIGDGRTGVFRITNTERKSIFKESTFLIDYVLVDYLTQDRLGDFNSKVVRTLYYVRDFLQYGQNPLVDEQSYDVIKQLKSRYGEVLRTYFRMFTSNEFKTLLLPGQVATVYDHFLMKSVSQIFSTWDAHQVRQCRVLNCDGDDVMKSPTIWDALLEQDKSLMLLAARRIGLVQTYLFSRDAMLEGIHYSGIRYVVYPRDPQVSVDQSYGYIEKPFVDDQLVNVPAQALRPGDETQESPLGELPWPDVPNINLVTIDDHYIFSQAFYEQAETGQSKLELSVRDYLNNKALDNRVLLTLANECLTWGGLEKFYYIPILLILVKASLRSF